VPLAAADSKSASASFNATPSVTVSYVEDACQPPVSGTVICSGYLDVTLTNFPSGVHTVSCFGTEQTGGSYQTTSATSTGCGAGGSTKARYTLWVTVDGVESNHVSGQY
jgi:hypothetical protein